MLPCCLMPAHAVIEPCLFTAPAPDRVVPRKHLLLCAGNPAAANSVCQHVACSASAVCIVRELEETKRLYRARTDQYRIKAVQVPLC